MVLIPFFSYGGEVVDGKAAWSGSRINEVVNSANADEILIESLAGGLNLGEGEEKGGDRLDDISGKGSGLLAEGEAMTGVIKAGAVGESGDVVGNVGEGSEGGGVGRRGGGEGEGELGGGCAEEGEESEYISVEDRREVVGERVGGDGEGEGACLVCVVEASAKHDT